MTIFLYYELFNYNIFNLTFLLKTKYILKKSHFFFFQAEDGIRDPLVTGVQTCALPISGRARARRRLRRRPGRPERRSAAGRRDHRGLRRRRSEERRVGKECRSRWS